MAEVYKAYQSALERHVAIKVLHAALAAKTEFGDRFHREARILARLQHPHIVPIYDFGLQDFGGHQRPYLVLAYLDGPSLKKRLRDLAGDDSGGLPLDETIHILETIASAVDYAHSQGVVHRDLKPQNILFSAEGQPILTDFGIARLLGEAQLTVAGAFIGTPAYMSPEQVLGKAAGPPSDIYGLGLILYEILSGRLPFEEEQAPHFMVTPSETFPSPCDFRPNLPPAVTPVVFKALAYRAEDRYARAGELADAFRVALAPQLAGGRLAPDQPFQTPATFALPDPAPSHPARQRPLTYRASEVDQVMNWLKAGAAVSLVSLIGAGKTQFVRFLLRSDVQRHYLASSGQAYVFIHIDFYTLAEISTWSIFELILTRLLEKGVALGLEPADLAQLSEYHREVVRTPNALLAQRAFERCLEALGRFSQRRLILILDHFDRVFAQAEATVFLSLRAAYDGHHPRLSYLVATYRELSQLRQNLAEADPFYRLFVRNVCRLGPYTPTDARFMLNDLAAAEDVPLTEEASQDLIDLSGGYAGFLKSLFRAYVEGRLDLDREPVAQLSGEAAIWTECKNIWTTLPPDEQSLLLGIVAGLRPGSIRAKADQALRLKGILANDPTPWMIFSPLFVQFIRRRSSKEEGEQVASAESGPRGSPAVPRRGIFIDPAACDVSRDGQRLPDLPPLQYKLLHYLWEHKGEVCTRGELAAHLYPDEFAGVSGHIIDEPRIDTLIARLRANIEPDRSRLTYIITVRGRGYKLVDPANP